jgi:hypothetical protein
MKGMVRGRIEAFLESRVIILAVLKHLECHKDLFDNSHMYYFMGEQNSCYYFTEILNHMILAF